MSEASASDLHPCSTCGDEHPRSELSRALRCDTCGDTHVDDALAKGATVHPTLPFARDPDAQRFVADHPDGATLEQVGDALGVTRERVRQLERTALGRLRKRAALAGIDPSDLAHVLAQRERGIAPSTFSEAPQLPSWRRPARAAKPEVTTPDDDAPESPEGRRVGKLLDDLERGLATIRTRDLEAAGRAVRELLDAIPSGLCVGARVVVRVPDTVRPYRAELLVEHEGTISWTVRDLESDRRRIAHRSWIEVAGGAA